LEILPAAYGLLSQPCASTPQEYATAGASSRTAPAFAFGIFIASSVIDGARTMMCCTGQARRTGLLCQVTNTAARKYARPGVLAEKIPG
jgi:hypothetical protein